MTVSPPTLYWYQLDTGTLAPAYYGQLDTCVHDLCVANSITPQTAPWYNPIGGTLNNVWILQIDTKVRALCTALSVTPPSGSPTNLIPGTETANYYASLDATVRALCQGGDYTASAVHFDGNVVLKINSIVATDGVKASFTSWFKSTQAGERPFWVVDPSFLYRTYFEIASNNHLVFAGGGFNGFVNSTSSEEYPSNAWFCAIGSVDLNNGVSKLKIYQGDADVTGEIFTVGSPDAVEINGKEFYLGGDGSSEYEGDAADFRLWPNVSLIDVDGNVPLATRRLFIDGSGKPVDPAVATAALGTPAVLFSGDATTFSTNQGTGGAASVIGGVLTNASTSPSD